MFKVLGPTVLQEGQDLPHLIAGLTASEALQSGGWKILLGRGANMGAVIPGWDFWQRGGQSSPRWHAAVPLGAWAATFQPGYFLHPLLFKRKRGRRAAGTQWSYPRYNTSRTKTQVGQEGAQNAPGRRQGRKVVNPPGRSHRKRRTLLPNKQNVALRFLPTPHLLPGCWGRHHRGILSFFAFLFHPNPRDPCPCLSGASCTSSSLKPPLFLPPRVSLLSLRNSLPAPGLAWQAAARSWPCCQSPGHPQGWE